MTKLVAKDDAGARIEPPRLAMSILARVGKPLQARDSLFVSEWVPSSGKVDFEMMPQCSNCNLLSQVNNVC